MKFNNFLCLLFVIIAVTVTVFALSFVHSQECRYASRYDIRDLVSSETVRNRFMLEMAFWEGKFNVDGLGVNRASGLTYDGHGIDYDTGLPHLPAHSFSAASKECIHLGLLALALTGNNSVASTFIKSSIVHDDERKFANFRRKAKQAATSSVFDDSPPTSPSAPRKRFYDVQSYVLDVLERKITSYEKWNKKYPGFGGYLPWYAVSDDGMDLLWDWQDRVPSLDNAELIWTLATTAIVLEDIGQKSLANRYWNYFKLLAETSIMVFYEGDGKIRCVTRVRNITAQPSFENYGPEGAPAAECYLDDPYEGELMAFFMDFYSDWNRANMSAAEERDKIWKLKRRKLQKATLHTAEGPIDVERGWWFSSHEKWKYMILPYTDVEINRRVFINGEKARVRFSREKLFGGLFASVTNVSQPGNYEPNYVSATGIQEIAFQPVRTTDLVTPYAAYPLLIEEESRPYGLAWYANMLQGSKMQGPLGSTESIDMRGKFISPVVTWDSKITSILAMAGGVNDLARKVMMKHGHYERFVHLVKTEWERVFDGELKGEEMSFVAPSTRIPNILPEFTAC